MKLPLKQHSTASCFATFLLQYLLYVPTFELRQKLTKTCCLGWNIGIFPSAAEREQHIGMVWKMVEADNQESPPPGLEQGVKEEFRMLAAQKRDLFPWIKTNIPSATLRQNGTQDLLIVQAGKSDPQEIELVTCPDPLGLPLIIEHLRRIHQDTAAQVALLDHAKAFDDIELTQMTTAYCVQRADLLGYHRMLTVWRDRLPEPSVKRVLGHWLGVVDEIEMDSKSVLEILTGCR